MLAGLGFLSISAFATEPPPAVEKPGPEPIQLRLKRFEIPFAVDSVGTRPTEVELFVSRDAGEQWAKYASQPPTGRTFLFDAAADGEYWFATRTIDGTGRSYPEGPVTPQLFVRIDTTDPKIDLFTELADDSTVLIDLRCLDQWPDRSTLKIEYTTDTNSHWTEVPQASDSIKAIDSDRLEGTIRFQPAGDWHLVSVRSILKDQAGNQTIATHQLQRPRLAGISGQLASSPLPRSSAPMSPIAPQTSLNPYAVRAMQVLNPAPTTNAAATPLLSAIAAENLQTPGPDSPYPGSSSPNALSPNALSPNALDSGFDFNQPLLAAPDQSPAATPAPTRRVATPAEAMRPITNDELAPSAPSSTSSPATTSPPAQSSARPSIEANQALPMSLPFDPAARLDGTTTSASIQHSGSRKFSLDYEVESAGRAGVEEVELWGTADRGQTWKRWGADPDRQTPFDIETNNDGVYGFCIVVVAKNGLATARPISQSPPDIFVVVDTLKPVVRITGATYGEGDQTGSLLIRYQCEDENISARPISLAFSNSPQGPWTTIAAGLENRGGYVWPADPQLPRQIYLRIDATDLSGNNGSYVLDTPIDIQGLAPRARIRGFNPITGSGATSGAMPQTATAPVTEMPSAKFK